MLITQSRIVKLTNRDEFEKFDKKKELKFYLRLDEKFEEISGYRLYLILEISLF